MHGREPAGYGNQEGDKGTKLAALIRSQIETNNLFLIA